MNSLNLIQKPEKMKLNYLFFAALSIIMLSCNKQDDPIPEGTEVKINGNYFSPTESSALKAGDGFIIEFKKGTKTITIRTNDTITGTYSVVSQSLKSASTLKANLTYFDGSTEYKGNEGTFRITKKEGNLIAGVYNSKVMSDKGLALNIESGSFIDVQTIPLLPNETAIQDKLATCYSDLFEYIELSYLFDAVYSNEIAAPNSSWTEIYNHAQSSSTDNEKILKLWKNGFEIIHKTNLILESSELVISDELSRNAIIAQAKAIRAYLFYNLMTWFGEIPLETGLSENTNPRNKIAEVVAQIKDDASAATLNLPIKWTSADSFRIPKSFALGILARLNLTDFRWPITFQNPPPPMFQYNNCNESVLNARQIINSGIYSLDNKTTNFTASDHEIVWGFEKRANAEFNNFFNKGSFVPVLRLTEVYLILAEALIQTGNPLEAVSNINLLNSRRSIPPVTAITPDEIFQRWRTELTPEGSLWVTKRRFLDKALAIVPNDPKKILLPVPMVFLIKNPNMTQNVGY